jgi:small GTP-binding protein
MRPTKVIFVGKQRTGKTRTVEQLLSPSLETTYEPTHRYTPTQSVHISTYKNKNGKEFNIWDIAGDMRYEGLGEAYYIGAELCVTFGNKKSAERKVKNIVPDIKIHNYSNLTKLKELLDNA